MQEAISMLADEVKKLKEKKSTPKKTVAKKAASNPKVVKKVASKPNKVIKNDLTVIEGIGPVLEGILQKSNLLTFKQISKKTGKQLKNILDKEGTKFQMHDPTTRPKTKLE